MTDYIHSRAPIVKRETLKLYKPVTIKELNKTQWVEFEREIVWLRESESTIALRHGGIEIDTRQTLNDYYGYLSSLESTIKEIAEWAKRIQITSESTLDIVASVKIFDCPVTFLPEDQNPDLLPKYRAVPEGRWWDYWFLSPSENETDLPPRLECRDVYQNDVAYSTLRDGITSDGRTPNLIAAWIAEQRILVNL